MSSVPFLLCNTCTSVLWYKWVMPCGEPRHWGLAHHETSQKIWVWYKCYTIQVVQGIWFPFIYDSNVSVPPKLRNILVRGLLDNFVDGFFFIRLTDSNLFIKIKWLLGCICKSHGTKLFHIGFVAFERIRWSHMESLQKCLIEDKHKVILGFREMNSFLFFSWLPNQNPKKKMFHSTWFPNAALDFDLRNRPWIY